MRRGILSLVTLLALGGLAGGLVSCNDSNPAAPANNMNNVAELGGYLSPGGGEYAHTFGTAGTFPYKCTIHGTCQSLFGTVVVVSASTPIAAKTLLVFLSGGSSDYTGSSCSSLSVQTDTVHVGDQVTWRNTSTLPHNVTSR